MASVTRNRGRRRLVGHLLFAATGVLVAMAAGAGLETSTGHPGSVTCRAVGALGTSLVLLALLYPLRRRGLFGGGALKRWLTVHEVLGTAGPLILVVHGGTTFHNTVAALAEALLIVMMFSGFIGRSLHRGVTASLGGLRVELEREGLSGNDIEDRLRLAAGASEILSRWRVVHYPLTAAFCAAAVCHILAAFYYGGFLP